MSSPTISLEVAAAADAPELLVPVQGAGLAAEQARAERAAVEAKARADREAREKLESEARAAKEAADKKAADEAEAARQAALAPERDKLLAFADTVLALEVPTLDSESGQVVQKALVTKLTNMAAWLRKEAKTL